MRQDGVLELRRPRVPVWRLRAPATLHQASHLLFHHLLLHLFLLLLHFLLLLLPSKLEKQGSLYEFKEDPSTVVGYGSYVRGWSNQLVAYNRTSNK